jgi:hypothetical protein
MYIGATLQVVATPVPSNTTDNISFKWESSEPAVATVNSLGLIKAIDEGKTVISVSQGTIKTAVKVTVSRVPVPLKGIDIDTGTTLSLEPGGKLQITATPNPVNTTDVSPFEWSSADESIATVNNGLITAVSAGQTTITVSRDAFSIEIAVKVLGLVGSWLFEDSNIQKATIGNDLVAYKMDGNKTVGSPDLSGFTVTDGPTPGSHAVTIDKGSYLFCNHGIAPNPQVDKVTEYTFMVEFRLPEAKRACFFQNDLSNTSDVDFFLRNNMTDFGIVGLYGNPPSPIEANRWYRVLASVKLGDDGWIRYYLDGENYYEGSAALSHGSAPWDKNGLLLFCDEDGEDEIMDVSQVAIWNVALTPEQVAGLK